MTGTVLRLILTVTTRDATYRVPICSPAAERVRDPIAYGRDVVRHGRRVTGDADRITLDAKRCRNRPMAD